MTFVYIFAHSSILRRKRPGIYPKEIKKIILYKLLFKPVIMLSTRRKLREFYYHK
ncbi:MAG: hypothetical protein LN588_02120 [Rickettsia endosymbiont of Bryobia graminum]|nr:hypothetical protein [Rickettsia endosymbiont of Bryobia graminum]